MTFEESIRMALTNNTERYKKTPCFIYVMHIEGTNFYKFGTAENVTKRKSNIISEWKREKGLNVKISVLFTHEFPFTAKALYYEAKIRKGLTRKKGVELFGNDYFYTNMENIVTAIAKML